MFGFPRRKTMTRRQALHSIAIELYNANQLKMTELTMLKDQITKAEAIVKQSMPNMDDVKSRLPDLLAGLANGAAKPTEVKVEPTIPPVPESERGGTRIVGAVPVTIELSKEE